MTLPAAPPVYATSSDPYEIRRGETGWEVYALQKALHFSDSNADGDFGPYTEMKVKEYQASKGIQTVGYAGPQTQRQLLYDAVYYVNGQRLALDKRVLKGFLVYEGGSLLAATNWYTPPNGTPGCDCGPVQWRQYGPPFNLDGLKRAFNPRTAFMYAGDEFLKRVAYANEHRPSLSDDQVLRASILAHNWPSGYSQIVKYGGLLNPNELATWTTKPDGTHYTKGEWAAEYPRRILSAGVL